MGKDVVNHFTRPRN